MAKTEKRKNWLALTVLCLGVLMIVLDTTIVNVALPSIRTSLGFGEVELAWVVNAYLLTFGGFLLLGGRLGDLFGHRRVFLWGLVLFTLASMACGFANSQWFLITARAIQGIGGAIVNSVALSLMMNLFTEPKERAKAMGVFGFVAAGGGSVGVLLGGFLTTINWHWIFLVNVPIGILVYIFSRMLLPVAHGGEEGKHIDVWGASTLIASLVLANYAVVNGNIVGWGSFQTLGLLGLALILLALFVWIESRVKAPLMPLKLFKLRNVVIANVVSILWSAGMFSWFFISALYMQFILSFTPLQVGLAFLPANLIMAAFSIGLSAKIIERFGIKRPLGIGLGSAAIGLLLLAFAPVGGSFVTHILPSMILLGIGAGIAFNPILLSAMSDVPQHESGLASGLVNTSFMMGGALGLAVLVSLASAKTQSLLAAGTENLAALNNGYHLAFIVGACFAALGALLGVFGMRISKELHKVEGHAL
ncbi:MAG TPA: MFS transporter [Candidatus Paceibacterota bacterium]|nr:MFS transporter [Candidatus Paceibacterota bacterium]